MENQCNLNNHLNNPNNMENQCDLNNHLNNPNNMENQCNLNNHLNNPNNMENQCNLNNYDCKNDKNIYNCENKENIIENSNSFNDTGILNSSYVVEELINTVDLRNIVPYEKKEKIGLTEFLNSVGIRFLDDSIVDSTRRDTLSKSQNVVDPALSLYYRYSMRERIEFFNTFSVYLSTKTKELQELIEKLEEGIDVGNLNKDMMKKIRNESRKRAKMCWYNLRKSYEMQFNRKMQSNKIILEESLSEMKKKINRLENEVTEKALNIKLYNDKYNFISSCLRVNSGDGKENIINSSNNNFYYNNLNVDKNSNALNIKLEKAEKLMEMINERKKLLEELENEYNEENKRFEQKIIEHNVFLKSIEKLKMENDHLRKNIMVSSVTEPVLEQAKKEFMRYCNLFKIKIIRITLQMFEFEIFLCNVTIEINSNFNVTACKIDNKQKIDFFELIDYSVIKNRNFVNFFKILTGKFILLDTIRNEYALLKDRYIAQSFYLKDNLYMRFTNHCENRVLDIVLNREGDLMHQGLVLGNINKEFGILEKIVKDKY